MNIEDKIKLAIEKGYSCDVENGIVYGINGKIIGNINKNGYQRFNISFNKKRYNIYSHIFIFYSFYGSIPKCIDHIDRNKTNNKIINLREVTYQQNCQNKNCKGYSWHKLHNKYISTININRKNKFLGYFNTEKEARDAYLEAKKKYHIID